MKRKLFSAVIVIAAAAMFMWFVTSNIHHESTTEQDCFEDTTSDVVEPTDVITREDTINAMAMAFARQESRFNHTAISPCGQWVGCLQLSEIMVREANRIVGFDCFDYSDRLDRQSSYAIFKIVMEKHNKNLEIERAIDIWNRYCPHEYRENVKNFFMHNLQNYNTLEDYFMLK